MTDIDEASNKLTIGVENLGTLRFIVESEVAKLSIPQQAINIVQFGPAEPGGTLQQKVRPLVGGPQIAFDSIIDGSPLGFCTLGVNAVRSGVSGFVTNSHCTVTQGGVENTIFGQPDLVFTSQRIGVETVDPTYFTGGSCPSGKRCRWSDTAFGRRDSTVTATRGAIAKLASKRSSTAQIVANFRIVSEVSFPLGGEFLNKVGRTTGWTSGHVTRTCVDSTVLNTNILLFCQDIVTTDTPGSAMFLGGDSGSPVFRITNSPATNDVELYGIAWAEVQGTGGTQMLFSAMTNLQSSTDLGPISTCNASFGC